MTLFPQHSYLRGYSTHPGTLFPSGDEREFSLFGPHITVNAGYQREATWETKHYERMDASIDLAREEERLQFLPPFLLQETEAAGEHGQKIFVSGDGQQRTTFFLLSSWALAFLGHAARERFPSLWSEEESQALTTLLPSATSPVGTHGHLASVTEDESGKRVLTPNFRLNGGPEESLDYESTALAWVFSLSTPADFVELEKRVQERKRQHTPGGRILSNALNRISYYRPKVRSGATFAEEIKRLQSGFSFEVQLFDAQGNMRRVYTNLNTGGEKFTAFDKAKVEISSVVSSCFGEEPDLRVMGFLNQHRTGFWARDQINSDNYGPGQKLQTHSDLLLATIGLLWGDDPGSDLVGDVRSAMVNLTTAYPDDRALLGQLEEVSTLVALAESGSQDAPASSREAYLASLSTAMRNLGNDRWTLPFLFHLNRTQDFAAMRELGNSTLHGWLATTLASETNAKSGLRELAAPQSPLRVFPAGFKPSFINSYLKRDLTSPELQAALKDQLAVRVGDSSLKRQLLPVLFLLRHHLAGRYQGVPYSLFGKDSAFSIIAYATKETPATRLTYEERNTAKVSLGAYSLLRTGSDGKQLNLKLAARGLSYKTREKLEAKQEDEENVFIRAHDRSFAELVRTDAELTASEVDRRTRSLAQTLSAALCRPPATYRW